MSGLGSSRVYREYQRDRVGWFLGLTGLQLGVLAAGMLPGVWAVHLAWWPIAALAGAGWLGLAVIVVVPVRGRSVAGWAAATFLFGVARLSGGTRWCSGIAAARSRDDGAPDLPPPINGLLVHTASSSGGAALSVAVPADQGWGVIENRATRRWTISARVDHAGTGGLTGLERDQLGTGLTALLDASCRTDLVSEVILQTRMAQDPGSDREHWLVGHRDPAAPALARTVHDDLRRHLTPAAAIAETFLTLVVADRRLRAAIRTRRPRRPLAPALTGARGTGGQVSAPTRAVARERAKAALVAEVAAELGDVARTRLGLDRVDWLTPAGLAEACRTGYHPDTPVALSDAVHHSVYDAVHDAPSNGGAASTTEPTEPTEPTVPSGPTSATRTAGRVETGVPWAVAGPAHTDVHSGWFVHDRWVSVSAAVLLPARGAVLGALAPVLMSGWMGERRCLTVGFPVMTAGVADRVTASREWAVDMGDGLRARAGVRPRARTRADNTVARAVGDRLVAGAALCRPWAIATTTIPADPSRTGGRDLSALDSEDAPPDGDVGEEPTNAAFAAARRLEAAIRRSGFAAQRLDLAHDTAFAVGCLPLGHAPDRSGGHR